MKYNPVTQDQIVENKNQLPTLHAISFVSHGFKLIGSLFCTNSEVPSPTVVLAHGFPGNEHNLDLAHSIRRAGFNVLIFHYRGCWGSEGVFSFSNSIEDLLSAYDFIKSEQTCKKYNMDPEKIVFIGHSMGGFAAFINANKLVSVKNIGFIAGFNFGLIADFLENPFAKEKALDHLGIGANMVNGTTPETLMEEIIANKDRFNLLKHVEPLFEKNLLMIAAKYDSTSMIEIHHKPLMKILKGHESINEKVLDSGHVFSTKRIELATIVTDWLNGLKFNDSDAE